MSQGNGGRNEVEGEYCSTQCEQRKAEQNKRAVLGAQSAGRGNGRRGGGKSMRRPPVTAL